MNRNPQINNTNPKSSTTIRRCRYSLLTLHCIARDLSFTSLVNPPTKPFCDTNLDSPDYFSVSGEVPENPVLSVKFGLLFKKRLIHRHISDYGKCPITGEPLTLDDIIPIKIGKIVKPRPVQVASLPGMLGMFQNGSLTFQNKLCKRLISHQHKILTMTVPQHLDLMQGRQYCL